MTTNPNPGPTHIPSRRWNPSSVAILVAAWLVLQLGGLFTPGLLDDVDSIYIQIAREMLQRHDFVTPTIDGIRFFDKPPLMYWMAAGSMRVFGVHDWAARLPLALGVLALFLSIYALGLRLFAQLSPAKHPDRGALYAALITATSIGPYLYTRFFIPDILVCLWMTLSVHCFLLAVDRAREVQVSDKIGKSAFVPMLAFGGTLALSILTKGLIGIVFPVGFAFLYLVITKQFRLLRHLSVPVAIASFLLIGAPWHILAALRNPAITMPTGIGLPAKAGWTWFYLYNEHVARFLSKRIPHDYGQTPVWQFWLLAFLWMMPWAVFLPSAIKLFVQQIRRNLAGRDAAITLFIWAGLVLGFFTLSARQEYYSLPALPALALLLGGALAYAEAHPASPTNRGLLLWSRWFLVPVTSLAFLVCGYFAIVAPQPKPGTDLNEVLSSNPEMYNLSLGHVFDLSSAAMAFFHGPLLTVSIAMLFLGIGSYVLRLKARTFRSNIVLAAAMCAVLMAAHEGLVRFNPILGSKDLALAIDKVRRPGDVIILDGELTSGSTLLFYTGQQVHLVNGRVNGPWFGSFWPDAPPIFEDEASLRSLWAGPKRIFLMTYAPEQRTKDLASHGEVSSIASAGGKTILSNKQ